jgi:hypothetical protein
LVKLRPQLGKNIFPGNSLIKENDVKFIGAEYDRKDEAKHWFSEILFYIEIL